jgi:DNA-binding NtrC family response regulator
MCISYLNNTKTILLVDDEAELRQLLCGFLKSKGYKVITADDGDVGINEYVCNQVEIDIVLMDIVMPRMNGLDARKEIIKIDPDAKIIMMSGFSGVNISSIAKSHFLPKPIIFPKLLSSIQDLLASPA